MDDGSRSGCDEGVADAAACGLLCENNSWDQSYFIDGDCSCNNGFPVSYETDSDDIDDDGDTTETIRWRYVVVIDLCRIVDGACQERHKVMRCWKDAEHD